jgi:hypothetical protein
VTRRDFELIAGCIRNMPACVPADVRRAHARHFAVQLAATNPRFDSGRFLAACGVDE